MVLRTELAWDVVTERYLPLFALAGRRAPLGEAVWQVNRANSDQLEPAVDAMLAQERASASDTHPPLRDRIAQVEAAARAGGPAEPPDAGLPAVDLLSGGAGWLSVAEGELLAENHPLASWDEVVKRGVRQSTAATADRLGAWIRTQGRGDGGLESVLALIDDTSDGGVVARLSDGHGPESLAEAVDVLADPVIAAMLATGAADVQLSWTGAARFVERGGAELQVAPRIEQAIAAGTSAPLRAWLAGLGVDTATSHVTRRRSRRTSSRSPTSTSIPGSTPPQPRAWTPDAGCPVRCGGTPRGSSGAAPTAG